MHVLLSPVWSQLLLREMPHFGPFQPPLPPLPTPPHNVHTVQITNPLLLLLLLNSLLTPHNFFSLSPPDFIVLYILEDRVEQHILLVLPPPPLPCESEPTAQSRPPPPHPGHGSPAPCTALPHQGKAGPRRQVEAKVEPLGRGRLDGVEGVSVHLVVPKQSFSEHASFTLRFDCSRAPSPQPAPARKADVASRSPVFVSHYWGSRI